MGTPSDRRVFCVVPIPAGPTEGGSCLAGLVGVVLSLLPLCAVSALQGLVPSLHSADNAPLAPILRRASL